MGHRAGFHVGADGVGEALAHGADVGFGAEGVGGDDAAAAHGVVDEAAQDGQAFFGGFGGGVVDGHLGDLAHGVAEGGRVGLPVDGAGAGRDDDGGLDEGEGARGRGGGVGQADAGGDDQDGASVEDAEHEALGLVGAREDGLGGLVVADGREFVQEGRGLHVHGCLDDGVDADARGEAEVHGSHRRGRGPPRSRSPRAGAARGARHRGPCLVPVRRSGGAPTRTRRRGRGGRRRGRGAGRCPRSRSWAGRRPGCRRRGWRAARRRPFLRRRG